MAFLPFCRIEFSRNWSEKKKAAGLVYMCKGESYGKEAVDVFLQECITESSQPVYAYFHVLAWADNPTALPDPDQDLKIGVWID